MYKMIFDLSGNKHLTVKQLKLVAAKMSEHFNTYASSVINGIIPDLRASSKAEAGEPGHSVVITVDFFDAYLYESEKEEAEIAILEQLASFFDSPVIDESAEPPEELLLEEYEHQFLEIEVDE